MIPTFFGISLIVFVVLNLAPGEPGAARNGDYAARLNEQGTQESYRIFKEQFALDKPTLLNTNVLLSKGDVQSALRQLLKTEANAAERQRAWERVESFGEYAVPYLISLLPTREQGLGETTEYSVHFLRILARQPLQDGFNPNPDPKTRAANKRINAQNAQIRELRFRRDATDDDKWRVVDGWKAWFAQHQARFALTRGEKLRRLLFDTRFARYWSNLVRLDFGVSLVSKEPVTHTLVGKLRYSLVLSLGSLILAYLIAIPLGVFSAVRRDTPADQAVTVTLFMLYSLPTFFVATLLLYFLSEGSSYPMLRWFPTGGFESQDSNTLTLMGRLRDIAWHITLPMVCMTYGSLAAISRYMRSGLLEVIAADYVRTAYAKGLPERLVIGKHALRNGLLPILTLLSGLLPAVLGGSVIVEYIFGIPGMGLWVIDSIYQRDYNVIMAVQLLSTVLVLLGILLTDLGYALVDPRIRYS